MMPIYSLEAENKELKLRIDEQRLEFVILEQKYFALANPWISVDDDLPKNGVYVHVVWQGTVQYTTACLEKLSDVEYQWRFFDRTETVEMAAVSTITHWSPLLPTPPEKE